MNQAQLNRAVARATGESVNLIRSLGFVPLLLPQPMPRPPRKLGRQRAARVRAASVRQVMPPLRAAA